jgi:uncharacterized protein (TIGR02271 family)
MASRTTRPDDTPGARHRTVVGLFTDRSEAESAIRDLKQAGFTDREVGVAMRDRDEQRDLMEGTGSTAAEGAAVGAVSGGLVGGLVGLLGSLLIPGVGPIVAGGVLASVLTGAGIGAAAGGIIGALMGLGVPETDARHFDSGLRSGGVLVTVDAGDRVLEALDILERHEADLGPSNAERFRGPAETSAADRTGELTDRQRLQLREDQLQLREEQLLIDNEAVQTGELTTRKEIITEQKGLDVPVSREEVVIERHSVNEEPIVAGPLSDTREFRAPISRERVNVEKRPAGDTQQVSDSASREEARIDTEAQATARPKGKPSAKSYKGKDRRRAQDTSYAGPERREAVL